MTESFNIYLYFIKEIPETDTWEDKFSYFLNLILSQITGWNIKMYSNLDVSGTKILKSKDINTYKFNAVILIQTFSDQSTKIESLLENDPVLTAVPSSKIFHVIKKRSVNQSKKFIFSKFQHYKFFEFNHRNYKLIDYNPDIPGDSENGFWEKLSDLSYDIKISNTLSPENSKKENSIYLAEVTDDQEKNRERIKRELILQGFQVIPSYSLSREIDEFEKKVTEELNQCILSVNILGEYYGETPQLSDYSYIELQNRIFEKVLADQKKKTPETQIQRIIWMQPNIEFTDDKQSQYIKRLQKDTKASVNTEIVQSSVSDLIEIICKKNDILKSEPIELIHEEQKPQCFVFYDSIEDEHIEILKKLLNKTKLSHILYKIPGSSWTDLNSFLNNVKPIENFLIINSLKPYSWVNSLISLIIRAKGQNDATPLASLTLYTFDTERDFSQFSSVKLDITSYRPYNFEEQITSIISKLKV
jgi:hypothetical protein